MHQKSAAYALKLKLHFNCSVPGRPGITCFSSRIHRNERDRNGCPTMEVLSCI